LWERNGFVGKLEFIRENHEVSREAEKIVEQLASQGKTSVVVSFGTGVAGIIGLTDTIKHDSISAIKQLQALNIELIMLTGIVKKQLIMSPMPSVSKSIWWLTSRK
jgi:Cd2+/Zn2+-exporting ATPase